MELGGRFEAKQIKVLMIPVSNTLAVQADNGVTPGSVFFFFWECEISSSVVNVLDVYVSQMTVTSG